MTVALASYLAQNFIPGEPDGSPETRVLTPFQNAGCSHGFGAGSTIARHDGPSNKRNTDVMTCRPYLGTLVCDERVV